MTSSRSHLYLKRTVKLHKLLVAANVSECHETEMPPVRCNLLEARPRYKNVEQIVEQLWNRMGSNKREYRRSRNI